MMNWHPRNFHISFSKTIFIKDKREMIRLAMNRTLNYESYLSSSAFLRSQFSLRSTTNYSKKCTNSNLELELTRWRWMRFSFKSSFYGSVTIAIVICDTVSCTKYPDSFSIFSCLCFFFFNKICSQKIIFLFHFASPMFVSFLLLFFLF